MSVGTQPTTYTFGASAPGMDDVNQANWYLATGVDALELADVEILGSDSTGTPNHVTGTATLMGATCTIEIATSTDGSVLAATPAAAWSLGTAFPALQRDPGDDTAPLPLLQSVSLTDPILLFSTSSLPDVRSQLAAWTTWSSRHANSYDDDGFAMYGTPDVAGAWETLSSLLGAGPLPLGLAAVTFASDDAPAPEPTILPVLEVAATLTGSLTLGPFTVSGPTLAIETALFDTTIADRVVLAGSVEVEGHTLAFSAELPLGDGEIVLIGTLDPTGGTSLIDAGTASVLPSLGTAGLAAELHLLVANGVVTVSSLGITLTATQWELLTGIVTVDDATFTIEIDDPLGTPMTSVGVDAGVTLLGRSIEISGTLPDGPIVGQSASGTALTLSGLVTQLGGDASLLPSTDIALDEIRVTHPVVSDDWEVLATASGTLGNWVGSVPVTLDELRFRLIGPTPVGIALDARLLIGTVGVAVAVTRTSDGLTFDGRTGAGQLIPVGQLVSSLTQYVADFTLPDPIAAATFSNLRVSYDSNASLDFAGELDLTIGGTPIHAGLVVTITHGSPASVTGTDTDTDTSSSSGDTIAADAVLLVAGQRFAVGLKPPAPGSGLPQMVVGSYAPEQNANGPDLRSLVDAIAPPVAEVMPSVTVADALVAIASPVAPATESRYLFGTDLVTGASIGAGDVGLGALSDLIGADLELSISQARIIVASDPFTGPECQWVTQVVQAAGNRPVTLPSDGVGRALLAVTLGICGEQVALELPIAAGSTNGTTSTTSAAPTPATPTTPGTSTTSAAPRTPGTTGTPNTALTTTAATTTPTTGGGITWYQLERAFGPVTVHRVGARYERGELTLALGVSIDARGLTIGLDGLSVTSPISSFDPSFDLAGLTIAYDVPPVAVSGGLLKVTDATGTRFDGEALLSTSAFTVAALGSYTTVGGNASLFIYALLQRDLGGPAAFYVTGLAAGFGYNRRLVLPSIDGVSSFPLVAIATGTRAAPGDPAAALAALGSAVQPAAGEFWLAAGVRFTSFQIVKSFALISVAFGGQTQIGLLGESRLTMPPEPARGQDPVAFARLAQRVSFEPDRGVLEVAAQLTPDSYVLSRDCHLSGGFAFYLWFKDQASGARAGDFALTLGGYHPRFRRPPHYPTVAPIRFDWRIGDLTLSGRVYFALTPSVVMAGGGFSAVWESGDIRAWFRTQADFLLAWKPFHYEAGMHVSIGVSVTVDLWLTSFTVEISVGVDLQLWGPSFGGEAEIDVSVVSFTIGFGAGRPREAQAISWQSFRDSFLPAIGVASSPLPALPAGIGPSPQWTGSYVGVRITAGLQRDLGDVQVVNGFTFEMVTDSQIPASTARFSSDDPAGGTAWTPDATVPPVEIGPAWLDSTRLVSEHVVLVRRLDPTTGQPQTGFDFFTRVTAASRRANVPLATWQVNAARSTGPAALTRINGENGTGGTGPILAGALVGFTFTGSPATRGTPLPAQVDVLQQAITPSPSSPNWCPDGIGPGPGPNPPTPSYATMASTMAAAQGLRKQLLVELGAIVTLDPDDRLTTVPSDLDVALTHVPAFLELGQAAPLGALG